MFQFSLLSVPLSCISCNENPYPLSTSYRQILVHGEQNEMARLKAALIRECEDNDQVHIEVHNPRNTEAVTLNFRGEKLAKVNTPFTFSLSLRLFNWRFPFLKSLWTSFGLEVFNTCVTLLVLQVMGSLADEKCVQGQRVSGILVKKNFNYHILNPSDLSSKYFSTNCPPCRMQRW